jgi:SpoIID/LytB domain protein
VRPTPRPGSVAVLTAAVASLALLTSFGLTRAADGPVDQVVAGLVAPVGAVDRAAPATELADPHAHRSEDPGTGPEAFVPAAPLEGTGAPITITGRGWGHSVGMSQYGAQAQALSGRDHATILGHYYPGTELRVDRRAEQGIAVNLFHNVADLDTARVDVQAAGGAGVSPVGIELGNGRRHALHRPHVWTVRHDGSSFVITGADGAVIDRGPGPVVVRHGVGERPPLLRMPQLAGAGGLAGTYRWGTLTIGLGPDGTLHPVLRLPVELYLRGLAEMPSSWHPEALAAQAVAGRGYAVRMVGDGLREECSCHLGTTPHDQAYAGWAKEAGQFGDRWVAAVRATPGRVLTYEGELAWTYYSSSHGDRTEPSGNSWAYPETLPYLVSVEDRWSSDPRVRNPMDRWTREISNADLARAVGLARVLEVTITERTEGGSPAELSVRGLTDHGQEVTIPFRGWRKGIAGADLKLALRSKLPSMQIESITVG